MSIPDLEELYAFKKCIRKYSRVKMRCIQYYQSQLMHSDPFALEPSEGRIESAPASLDGVEKEQLAEKQNIEQILKGLQRFQADIL